MKRLAKIRSVSTLVALVCLGCSQHKKDTLVVGILNAPLSLMSWKIRDGASTLIGNQIHRGLLRIDPQNGHYIGAAATHWEFVRNRSWIRFHLDLERKFHDGTSLNCSEVKTSFDRLVKSTKNTAILFPKDIVFECETSSIFTIKAKTIPAQLLDTLASPAAAISRQDGTTGLGPYRLKVNNDRQIQLERVTGSGPNIITFVISDHIDLVDKFKKKELDDLLYLGLFIDIDIPCARVSGLSPTSFWFGINRNSWHFSERKQRLLVQELIKAGLAESRIFENEIRNNSLIPFGVKGNRLPSSEKEKLIQSEIRNKLKPDVKRYGKISITLRNIQKYQYRWNDLKNAIDPNSEIFDIKFLDNKEFFERYYSNRLTVFFVGANVTRNDPFEVLSFFRTKDFVNQSGISENTIDILLEKSANAESSSEIKTYAEKANNWIISEGYALPLFSKRFSGCIQSNLSGYKLSPLGPLSIDYSQVKIADE